MKRAMGREPDHALSRRLLPGVIGRKRHDQPDRAATGLVRVSGTSPAIMAIDRRLVESGNGFVMAPSIAL